MDEARFESALKEGTAADVLVVVVPDIQAPNILHEARNTLWLLRRQQKMNMVGHKNPTVHLHTKLFSTLGQPVGVGSHILIRYKTNLAIVTSLYDMYGIANRT